MGLAIGWRKRTGYRNGPYHALGSLFGVLLTHRGSIVQVQGSNIRHYYAYLLGRAKAYRDTRIDWVREGHGRLKRQIVDKGLLRETETVQSQIAALLKCDVGNNCMNGSSCLTDPAAYFALASQQRARKRDYPDRIPSTDYGPTNLVS
jgi:hypothetical protein